MKTPLMFRELAPLDQAAVRQLAASIGLDLARGHTHIGEVLQLLGITSSDDRDVTTALRILRDLLGAYMTEQAALRRDAKLAAVVQEPVHAALIERLAKGAATVAELRERDAEAPDRSTVWRRLQKLRQLGLVELDGDNDERYQLTPRGQVAVRAGVGAATSSYSEFERCELERCAERPLDELQLTPNDRTLYVGLCHWAAEMLARPIWTAIETATCHRLRRLMGALSEPGTTEKFVTDADAWATDQLRPDPIWQLLWRYRTFAPMADQSIVFESEFANVGGNIQGVAALPWAIAAIKIAKALEGVDRTLQASIRARVEVLLADRDEPIAVFWRNVLRGEHADAKALIQVRIAPEHRGLRHNLTMFSQHLEVVSTSNRQWAPIGAQLVTLREHLARTFPQASFDGDRNKLIAWLLDERDQLAKTTRAWLEQPAAAGLVAAARAWLSSMEPLLERAPLITRRDRNLLGYARLCAAIATSRASDVHIDRYFDNPPATLFPRDRKAAVRRLIDQQESPVILALWVLAEQTTAQLPASPIAQPTGAIAEEQETLQVAQIGWKSGDD